jgi:uncharacterized protein (TIGR01244 family)
MLRITRLSPQLAVAGLLAPDDFAVVASLGFRTVINNRPDGEEMGQLTACQEALLARRLGLGYRHVPAAKHEVLDDAVLAPLAQALGQCAGPVLLHCRSGLRSAIMWAALEVDIGSMPDSLIARAQEGGIDLAAMRDELVERAAMRAARPAMRHREAA